MSSHLTHVHICLIHLCMWLTNVHICCTHIHTHACAPSVLDAGEACASLCFRGDLCRPSSSKLLPQNSIRGVVHSFIMPSAVLSNPSTCLSMRVSLAQSLSVEEPSHGILRGEVEVLGRTPSGYHTYFCTGTFVFAGRQCMHCNRFGKNTRRSIGLIPNNDLMGKANELRIRSEQLIAP